MRKLTSIAVGTLALAAGIAASGCGEDSGPEATSRPATTTAQTATQPVFDIAKFRAAYKDAYGTPPNQTQWYGLVTGMTINDGYLDIATKLDPNASASGDENGPAICAAASKLALDLGVLGNGIVGVRVAASDGVYLGACA